MTIRGFAVPVFFFFIHSIHGWCPFRRAFAAISHPKKQQKIDLLQDFAILGHDRGLAVKGPAEILY